MNFIQETELQICVNANKTQDMNKELLCDRSYLDCLQEKYEKKLIIKLTLYLPCKQKSELVLRQVRH